MYNVIQWMRTPLGTVFMCMCSNCDEGKGKDDLHHSYNGNNKGKKVNRREKKKETREGKILFKIGH